MNELSTKITRLDLDYILDNCFKPALWDKQWTIFKYGNYKITFEIWSIDVKRKQVHCTLRLFDSKGSFYPRDTDYEINFQPENRNLQVIQSGLNGKIYRWLIETAEQWLIMQTPAYQEAQNYQARLVELAEEKAIALLNEQNITDEDVREAYIGKKRDDAYTWKYTVRVDEDYKGSKLTSLFLAYALFADDKEHYEYYKKLAKVRGFKLGKLRKEIKAELAKIESGEMEKESD